MPPSHLVIVESPAKAKTINKYLGKDYHVMASYGHIRDLPPKDGSVLPDQDFSMAWTLSERADKTVRDLTAAAKASDSIILATDPDREGEAISWHIREILNEKKLLEGRKVSRVTFNEITQKAVKEAFSKPRDLDTPLIEAYLARRALDYLVGFTLSPVLWRKLPGARSAGRVQSVALRLICEREAEIEAFKAQEYWTIGVRLQTPDGAPFWARLTHLAGNKLDKLDIPNEEAASAAVLRIQNKALAVQTVEKKQVRRFPAPPFITSTLQMEASRKLRFSASQTMRTAQQLYEGVDLGGETVGLITYMRTDGTNLSDEAIGQIRGMIKSEYGDKYLPGAPRQYKSKAKNAQEAHEAIRPTSISRHPRDVAKYVDERQAALYELIWKRAVASQMENAVLDQVTADISDGTDDVVLRATGSTVAFDGFLSVYQEDEDDNDAPPTGEENPNASGNRLPPLAAQDKLKTLTIDPDQHFTQPPPRYSEASLVKNLEEMGIGRPSTYASIIQVLQDRNYVVLDRRRFVPEDRGRLVTAFLKHFFEKYVDYDFTANLENELDAISSGHVAWKEALRQFWKDFKAAVDNTAELRITDVLDHLDRELGPHFFPVVPGKPDPRECPVCHTGRLSLKLGKFGAFIGCSQYPDCKYTRPLAMDDGGDTSQSASGDNASKEPKILGNDPETGRSVSLRFGPYGPYVQIEAPEVAMPAPAAPVVEETGKKSKTKKAKSDAPKPKRQGLPRGLKPDEVTLPVALQLLSLPRLVGMHPETRTPIEAGIGRFGPYLKHEGKFKSIPASAGEDVLTIGLNRAVDLLAQPSNPRKGGGRFGKKKAAAEGDAPVKKTAAKKAPAKKAAAKKPAAKKPAKKKA